MSLTPEPDTNPTSSVKGGPVRMPPRSEVNHRLGQLDRIWHASDQLAAAEQSDLTTMSDHNEARQSRIESEGSDVDLPAHGQFPTTWTYLTSEGSASGETLSLHGAGRVPPLPDHI